MGKLSTLALLLFCTLHVHSFNLRSDTDSSSVDPSGTELTGPGDNTKEGSSSGPADLASDPAQHLHDAANKWLTPAEQLHAKLLMWPTSVPVYWGLYNTGPHTMVSKTEVCASSLHKGPIKTTSQTGA